MEQELQHARNMVALLSGQLQKIADLQRYSISPGPDYANEMLDVWRDQQGYYVKWSDIEKIIHNEQ